jgi:hypothetical protein
MPPLRWIFIPFLVISIGFLAIVLYLTKAHHPAMPPPLESHEDSDAHHFYSLTTSAPAAFNAGKYDEARQDALELETITPPFQGNWNYGNAIQNYNLVFGRLALRDGDLATAKTRLLAAGHTPGSPQLDSFGPNMSLARELLIRGETESVLQYFELCRVFWKDDFGKLDEWKKAVQAGQTPDFGANLAY